MDVHAPHQPLHTWKDFWIHLGTITIGLLIAISLEQSVEGLHHLHQRHQLEEDLRAEAAKNILILDRNYRNLDTYMAWASTMRDIVNAMHASGGKTKLPYPPKPDLGQTITREEWDEHPGIPTQVADTIGAGDAFTAALTHYMLRGADLATLNEAGNRWGAWVASQSGAMPALSEEVHAKMELSIEGRV